MCVHLLQGLEEFGGVPGQEPDVEPLTPQEPVVDPMGLQDLPLHAPGSELQAGFPSDGGGLDATMFL